MFAKQHIPIVSNKQDDQNCFLYYQSVGFSLQLQILQAVVYEVRYLKTSKHRELYVIPRCCCIGERGEKNMLSPPSPSDISPEIGLLMAFGVI